VPPLAGMPPRAPHRAGARSRGQKTTPDESKARTAEGLFLPEGWFERNPSETQDFRHTKCRICGGRWGPKGHGSEAVLSHTRNPAKLRGSPWDSPSPRIASVRRNDGSRLAGSQGHATRDLRSILAGGGAVGSAAGIAISLASEL
jgi:hypothetical protein